MLITLTIVGVIAALIIPNLMHKWQQKEMEVSFKKSYSRLQQAFSLTDPSLYRESITSQSSAGRTEHEFYKDVYNNYNKIAQDLVEKYGVYRIYSYIKTYNKTSGSWNGCIQWPLVQFADGSALGIAYNCWSPWIVLDTNGPKKGPNAYGHDIFNFTYNSQAKIIPLGSPQYGHWELRNNSTYCSKASTNSQNGGSCAYFAVINKCPDDQSKTYWECLP